MVMSLGRLADPGEPAGEEEQGDGLAEWGGDGPGRRKDQVWGGRSVC